MNPHHLAPGSVSAAGSESPPAGRSLPPQPPMIQAGWPKGFLISKSSPVMDKPFLSQARVVVLRTRSVPESRRESPVRSLSEGESVAETIRTTAVCPPDAEEGKATPYRVWHSCLGGQPARCPKNQRNHGGFLHFRHMEW